MPKKKTKTEICRTCNGSGTLEYAECGRTYPDCRCGTPYEDRCYECKGKGVHAFKLVKIEQWVKVG